MNIDEKIELDNLGTYVKMITRKIESLDTRLVRLEAQTGLLHHPTHPIPFELLADAFQQYRTALWSVSGPEASSRLAALDEKFAVVVKHFSPEQQKPTQ